MKCIKASTYEIQKMFTHLLHVSWGQCVFSTVMNGKLLINWCNHHTKKKKTNGYSDKMLATEKMRFIVMLGQNL